MDPGAIPPEIAEKLPWMVLAGWMVWKRLERQAESQKAQGERIGRLEDRVSKLEGPGGAK